MMNFQFLPPVDPTKLLIAIKSKPDLWKEDTYLRDYPQGPFGEIESIMLRFPKKRVAEMQEEIEAYKKGLDQHECIDYPAYAILICAELAGDFHLGYARQLTDK